jgi:hypothetical protein
VDVVGALDAAGIDEAGRPMGVVGRAAAAVVSVEGLVGVEGFIGFAADDEAAEAPPRRLARRATRAACSGSSSVTLHRFHVVG